MSILTALVLAATALAAQPPAGSPQPGAPPAADELAAVVRAIDAAHRGPAAPAKVEAFRAQVQIEPRARDQDSVTVDLDVEFQAPRALRTSVREKGVRIERGNDPRRGGWVRTRDGVTALQGPEHEQDAETVVNQTRLCNQVLRFLDPARLIGEMTDKAPVRREDLRVFRLRYPGCRVVEGTLPSFPTYTAGSEGPARVTVFVHGETDRLLAIQAVPLDEQGRPKELGEFVLLEDFEPEQDVLLPRRLTVFPLRGPGREQPTVTVKILRIELAPTFAADHFARPR